MPHHTSIDKIATAEIKRTKQAIAAYNRRSAELAKGYRFAHKVGGTVFDILQGVTPLEVVWRGFTRIRGIEDISLLESEPLPEYHVYNFRCGGDRSRGDITPPEHLLPVNKDRFLTGKEANWAAAVVEGAFLQGDQRLISNAAICVFSLKPWQQDQILDQLPRSYYYKLRAEKIFLM